jgi:hypothetical protein
MSYLTRDMMSSEPAARAGSCIAWRLALRATNACVASASNPPANWWLCIREHTTTRGSRGVGGEEEEKHQRRRLVRVTVQLASYYASVTVHHMVCVSMQET